MDRIVSFAWCALLALVAVVLLVPETRIALGRATEAHPYLMGMAKIGLLGTMGELLGARIASGRWPLTGTRLHQRALVWALFGAVFAVVFPLFAFGVAGLLQAGYLPGAGSRLATAAWTSTFMNLVFGFPMMVSHRVTDGLIDRNRLFSGWPLLEVWKAIDWRAMFHVVGAACFWFWIPAHTVTFLLPPEYRVLSAALLAIALGAILGFAKRLAARKAPATATVPVTP